MKFKNFDNPKENKQKDFNSFAKNIISFEDFNKKESLKRMFVIDLKSLSVVSNITDAGVRIIENNSTNTNDLHNLYASYDRMYEIPNEKPGENFLYYEDKIYKNSREITQADFKYLKDFSKEDYELLYKLLGPYKFGLSFNFKDLDLDELVLFARSLKNADVKTFDRLISYKEKLKDNFSLKPFISLSQGDPKMLEKILTLSEKLPNKISEKVFIKYGEIIDLSDNVENLVKSMLKKQEHVSFDKLNKIKENILLKGKDLLVESSDMISNLNYVGDDKIYQKLVSQLDEIQKDNIIFSSTFKTLKQEGVELSFQDIDGLVLDSQTYSTEFLSNQDIEQMKNITEENYKDKPHIQKEVVDSLRGAILGGYNYTDFYMLKLKDKIIAFCRFDWDPIKKEVYFGSFNVNKNFGNGLIATTMLDEVVNQVYLDISKIGYHMKADSSKLEPITTKYIELGFVVDDEYDFKGEPSLKISRNKEQVFESKSLKKEDIIKQFKENKFLDNLKVFAFEKQSDLDTSLLKEGYKITRYFFESNIKKWLVVYEKLMG